MSTIDPPDQSGELEPPPSVPIPVIEKGRAQEAVSEALDRVTAAVVHLEALSMALARALDGAA